MNEQDASASDALDGNPSSPGPALLRSGHLLHPSLTPPSPHERSGPNGPGLPDLPAAAFGGGPPRMKHPSCAVHALSMRVEKAAAIPDRSTD